MYWNKQSWKGWKETKIGKFLIDSGLGKFLIIGLIVFAFLTAFYIYSERVVTQPIREAHVEVVEKRIVPGRSGARNFDRTSYYVTFKFTDNTEMEFNIWRTVDAFHSLQEGDTGTLFYKQVGDSTRLSDLRFVSFEKHKAAPLTYILKQTKLPRQG